MQAQQLVSILRGTRKTAPTTRVVDKTDNHRLARQGGGWRAPAPLSLQEWDQQLTSFANKYDLEKEGEDDEEFNEY